MNPEETSENFIHFKVRTFIGIVGGMVIGTNVVNTVLSDIKQNEEMIQYNAEAEDRRRQHLEKQFEYKLQIIELKEDLKKCKEQ